MNFEEFIKKNRSEFDNLEEVPRNYIWAGIQHQQASRNKFRSLRLYSVAATVLLVISVSALIYTHFHYNPPALPAGTDNSIFPQKDPYYQNANTRLNAIDISGLDKDIFGELLREYEIADSQYMELRNDISQMPNAQQAIDLAIKHQENRLRILELIEREIENQKRFEENEREIKL